MPHAPNWAEGLTSCAEIGIRIFFRNLSVILQRMDLNDSVQQALSILVEEQTQPTLYYRFVQIAWLRGEPVSIEGLQSSGMSDQQAAQEHLKDERNNRPREVHEDPKSFVFESTNFDLLVKVFSLVAEEDRDGFIHALLHYVRNPMRAADYKHTVFSSFHGEISALGLLAEFCVRTGHLHQLLAATSEAQFPTISLAIMLKQIEEMIALNFNLFSDNELATLPARLATLRDVAEKQTYSARGPLGGPMKPNPHYKAGRESEGTEIVASIDGIAEECRKGRYFYLKGALQELPNLEIEKDKLKVEGFLTKLGFSDEMVKTLNAAESDYKSTATTFELKNCLGHLRSFLEHLHREATKSISHKAGDTVTDRWGDAILYLRQRGYFTKQHETFVASLYTLLSDESVHPLTADREYARLLRNVVIEYGVMFLTVLDKRGLKI